MMITTLRVTSVTARNLSINRTMFLAAISVTFRPAVSYGTKNKANFKVKPFKLHKLTKAPSTEVTLTSKDALNLYAKMVKARRFENECAKLYREKFIRGFCHLYIGQEAIAVGMASVMRDVDTVITSYRCHAWLYLCGASIFEVIAELCERTAGNTRGKGGSMHMFTKKCFGGNGIVGAQVPLGAGLALAHKYKNDGGITFCAYGDGAANQGQIFEAYNLSKLLALPCCFVCENNIYGMGTSMDRSSASTDYYSRGDYVPGIWVDGMDVLATREATKYAIDYITSGKGPLVMEMQTYRYMGHSMSDPGTSYRSRDEVQKVRESRDPIVTFRKKITEAGIATAEQLKNLDEEAIKEVADASKRAKASAIPAVSELVSDVYHTNIYNYIRNVVPDKPLPHVNIAVR